MQVVFLSEPINYLERKSFLEKKFYLILCRKSLQSQKNIFTLIAIIMKKTIRFFFFSLILTPLLMGCETNSTQKIQGDDELTKIITTYAQNFENYELTNNTIELENNQTISGITLTTSGVKEVPNLSTFFDGWEVNELGDTISASLISYET